MRLLFEERALGAMYEWLTKFYPEEACGFLVGREQQGIRTITETWPATNVSSENRKRRFIVDPLDYMRAEKKAVIKGLSLLGIYHSHPEHPAIPSEHDLAAAHPFFSYTIVSLMNGAVADIRSYQLQEEKFVEEEVETQTHPSTPLRSAQDDKGSTPAIRPAEGKITRNDKENTQSRINQ